MKKLITIVLLIVITCSCSETKKNKESGETKIDNTQSDVFFSAKIDGEKFYTDTPIYFSSQKIISLAGVNKDKTKKIRIYINYINGPATYNFGKGISNSDNMVLPIIMLIG